MGRRYRSEIDIEKYIPGIEQDGLPQGIDCSLGVVCIFVSSGCQFKRLRVWIRHKQGLKRGKRLLRPVSHQLNRCQNLTFPPIVRAQSKTLLKYCRRFVEMFQLDQAGGIGVQCRGTRLKKRGSLFKM